MIKVVSYHEAKRLHVTEEILKTHNVVSLLDTGLGSPFMCSIYEGFPNKAIPETLLTLHIDDVIRDDGYYRPWAPVETSRLFNWMDRVKGNGRPFLAHCWMGVSRSGAVGTYIAKEMGQDLSEFFDAHPIVRPNFHILSMLLGYAEASSIEKLLETKGRVVCRGHD